MMVQKLQNRRLTADEAEASRIADAAAVAAAPARSALDELRDEREEERRMSHPRRAHAQAMAVAIACLLGSRLRLPRRVVGKIMLMASGFDDDDDDSIDDDDDGDDDDPDDEGSDLGSVGWVRNLERAHLEVLGSDLSGLWSW